MISTCIWTHILPCIVWSKAHLTTYVSVNAVVHVNHWVLWMPCTWIRLSRKNGVFAEFVICHPSCFVTCGSWDHKKPPRSHADDSLVKPVPVMMTAWFEICPPEGRMRDWGENWAVISSNWPDITCVIWIFFFNIEIKTAQYSIWVRFPCSKSVMAKESLSDHPALFSWTAVQTVLNTARHDSRWQKYADKHNII